MKRPPTIPEALWNTFSDEEKNGAVAAYTNRGLVIEVSNILKTLPQETLCILCANILSALNGYNREASIDNAYRALNVFERVKQHT